MRLMPVFSLPSISSLTSDLHVKPCLHTSPPPLAPPTPALGQGQKEEFPRKERTREKKGFRDLFQHATKILQIPPRSHAGAAVCVCRGRNGKGLKGQRRRSQLYSPPSPLIPEAAGAYRHAAPHAGIAASHAPVREAPGRCAAKLRRDHNSNDRNEGDGGHPDPARAPRLAERTPQPVCRQPRGTPRSPSAGCRGERRLCAFRGQPSPDAAPRAPVGCGDAKQAGGEGRQRGGEGGCGAARSGDG